MKIYKSWYIYEIDLYIYIYIYIYDRLSDWCKKKILLTRGEQFWGYPERRSTAVPPAFGWIKFFYDDMLQYFYTLNNYNNYNNVSMLTTWGYYSYYYYYKCYHWDCISFFLRNVAPLILLLLLLLLFYGWSPFNLSLFWFHFSLCLLRRGGLLRCRGGTPGQSSVPQIAPPNSWRSSPYHLLPPVSYANFLFLKTKKVI